MEEKTCQTGQGVAEGGVSRRSFIGAMGAAMAGAAAVAVHRSAAFADEADEDAADEVAEEAQEDSAQDEATGYFAFESTTGWTGTPEDVLALGVSTMPLEDLNQYRRLYLDAQTEYTMTDGTVVPLPYVQMRALIHSYGMGCGNTPYDGSYASIIERFTEDEASAFVDMPWGVEFTTFEMSVKTGRTVEECSEICEHFAEEGYLCAFTTNRGRCFHQVPFIQGVIEYQLDEIYESDNTDAACSTLVGIDMVPDDMANTGTPTFYYVPVNADVTSDGTLYAYDDVRQKVLQNNYVAICPCACRYSALAASVGHENIPSFEDFATGEYEDYFSELCDQRVETCIMTGDEAEFWVESGLGRRITAEEAVEFIDRSVEDGFMLESRFGKNSDTICSCHIDSCNVLNMWASIGDSDAIAATDAFKQVSHYTLEVDPDKCIACGLCVDRCPLRIISINDEGWAEPAANCMRCGQCCYICPQGARTLVLRDESELAPLPQGMLEDSNAKAAYRFEKGLIF